MYIVTPADQELSVSLLVQLPVASVIMGGNDPRYLVAQEQYAIIDTLPVYPGAHSVEVLYFVPYAEGAVIDLPLNNPLSGTVDVYLADERLTLNGENFAFVGATEIGSSPQTQNANHYRAQLELDAGQNIVFDVSGDISVPAQEAESTPNPIQQYLPIVLIVIAVLLLFGAALVIGLRSRIKASDGSSEMDRLIAELAQLEDLHESGRINHDYYQQKRQTMRQRLTELMNQQTDKRES
jgi:hypothetical protein